MPNRVIDITRANITEAVRVDAEGRRLILRLKKYKTTSLEALPNDNYWFYCAPFEIIRICVLKFKRGLDLILGIQS